MPHKKVKQFLVPKTSDQCTWIWWWMRFQRILASEVVNSRIDSCNKVGTHSRAFRSSLRGGWEEIPGRINGPPQIPATSPRSKRCRERLTIQRFTLPGCLFCVVLPIPRVSWHRYVNYVAQRRNKLVLTSKDLYTSFRGEGGVKWYQSVRRFLDVRMSFSWFD